MEMNLDLGDYDYHEHHPYNTSSENGNDVKRLSWRMSPEESWSDWTICLSVRKGTASATMEHSKDGSSSIGSDDLSSEEFIREFHVHKVQVRRDVGFCCLKEM